MSFASFFQSIPSMLHTFLGYVGKTLKGIGKYEPQIADFLSHSMNYIEPLAVDVVTLEYGTGAGAVADSAIKDLLISANSLKSLIYDWQNSPGIIAKFRALAADAGSIIALGHVKNPEAVAKVQRIASEAAAAADLAEASHASQTATPTA